MPKQLINLAGQKIGKLTILERVPTTTHGNVRWLCLCECGRQCTRLSGGIRDPRRTREPTCGNCGELRRRENASETCHDCGDVLVVGQNIRESFMKIQKYVCSPCDSKRGAAWVAANWLKHRLQDISGRAKRLGVPFSLTPTDVVIPDTCPVFGIEIKRNAGEGKGPRPHSPSFDRIDPNLGYVPGNVRVISHRANNVRGKRTDAQVWQSISSRAFSGKLKTVEAKEAAINDRIRVAVWLSYGQGSVTASVPITAPPFVVHPVTDEIADLYRGGAA